MNCVTAPHTDGIKKLILTRKEKDGCIRESLYKAYIKPIDRPSIICECLSIAIPQEEEEEEKKKKKKKKKSIVAVVVAAHARCFCHPG